MTHPAITLSNIRRILYICSSWPQGPSFGGQLRALYIGRALKHVGKVTVLVVSSEASNCDAMAQTAAEFDVLPPILPEFSPNRGVIPKLRWAFDTRYMNLHGYVASMDHKGRLDATLKDFDLVWILNSRTPNIIQTWNWPRSHLDLDDIPSTYLRTSAQSTGNFRHRLKANVQQRILKRRERLFDQRFTTLSVCSEADKMYLGGGDQIHVIPNGFMRPATMPTRDLDVRSPRIGFIGLYSYPPNVDGVRWFIKNCWPAIRTAIPGIRLRLIGKDTDGALKPTEPDIDALGWIKDPSDEISTWSCMIIPIRFGGGTRIKLAESFSRKCPAVATHVGAFGYDVKTEHQLCLADTPDDFSRACINLVLDPNRGVAIAERAWTEFLNKWTWDAIFPRVHAAAEDCLRRIKNK